VRTDLPTTELDSGSEILSKKFREFQTHDLGPRLQSGAKSFQVVTSSPEVLHPRAVWHPGQASRLAPV
jgi:hypothetical protein